MPTNRKILYTIRMRNAASAAIRQLNADMKAQGTTLKEVARQVQAVTTELGKLEGVVTKTDKAMSGMVATATGLFSGIQMLAQNLQLVVTAFVAFKALQIAPVLAGMAASFVASATAAAAGTSSLLVYNVATRSVALGASAANIAVTGLKGALAFFGGPIGFLITAAATAVAFFATQTKDSTVASTELEGVLGRLKGAYERVQPERR